MTVYINKHYFNNICDSFLNGFNFVYSKISLSSSIDSLFKRAQPLTSQHPCFNALFSLQTASVSIHQRKLELEDQINEIFHSMKGNGRLLLKTHSHLFPTEPPCARKDSIYMPPLFFVSPKEFPPELQVSGPDDPKLDDDLFFERLASWISKTFCKPKQTISWEDKQAFKLYIRFFIQDPTMAARAVNFILHHEVAHILHDHNHKLHSYFGPAWWPAFLLFMTAILMWICKPLGNFLDRSTQWMATKQMEGEADRTALHATNDIEGIVYLFETMKAQNRQSRQDPQASWSVKLMITSSGDFIPYILSHQLESNRIASLKKEHEAMSSPRTDKMQAT